MSLKKIICIDGHPLLILEQWKKPSFKLILILLKLGFFFLLVSAYGLCPSERGNAELLMAITGGIPSRVPLQSRGQKTRFTWIQHAPPHFNASWSLFGSLGFSYEGLSFIGCPRNWETQLKTPLSSALLNTDGQRSAHLGWEVEEYFWDMLNISSTVLALLACFWCVKLLQQD